MSSENITELTELELDTLQELMNISFGQAVADLAEAVNIFIELKSPNVKNVPAKNMMTYINSLVSDFKNTTIIEQHYYGEIKGVAVLVFYEGSEKELLTLFQEYENRFSNYYSVEEMEKEVLMELGNYLIGACLGNLFKTLKSQTTYLHPSINSGSVFENIFMSESVDQNDTAITMSTSFSFENRKITGTLFIINNNSSLDKIQQALVNYWKMYNVL